MSKYQGYVVWFYVRFAWSKTTRYDTKTQDSPIFFGQIF